MGEHIGDLAEAPKRNRGWFQPGDERINKQGRPVGRKVTDPEGQQDIAQAADRVMLLFIDERYLANDLVTDLSPRIHNLPSDFQIVGCRFDDTRNGVVFIVRSREFPRIAKGAVIPEFQPHFYGLRYRASRWPTWE